MSHKDKPEERLPDADQALLDRVAVWICDRRMETPAVLFLETARPLSFVGSQAMHFFDPLVRHFDKLDPRRSIEY